MYIIRDLQHIMILPSGLITSDIADFFLVSVASSLRKSSGSTAKSSGFSFLEFFFLFVSVTFG